MTTDKQAVKAIADAIIKATRVITDDNNKTYVNNQIKNNTANYSGGSGAGGGSGSYSGNIPASHVTGLYNTVADYIINAQTNADGGDVIAGKIISTLNGLADIEVSKAKIGYAQIEDLAAGVATIMHLAATTAEIQDADIRQLKADVSQLGLADIGTAKINYAQIQDLSTQTAIFRESVGNKLAIDRLAVSEANMVSLSVGELMLRNSNGDLVKITVDSNGNIGSQVVEFEGDQIIVDNTLSGTKIIENSITARELNVSSIFADQALIRAIKAQNIDVSDLFANNAFIGALSTSIIQSPSIGEQLDISGNSSINLLKNRINLIVTSGSDETSLTLTENMIKAVSDVIDVKADTIDLSANTSIATKVKNVIDDTIVQSNVAPANPTTDTLWIDTGSSPNSLKRWDGTKWVVVNDADLTEVNNKITTMEATISQQNDRIALSATKEEVNSLSGEVTRQIGEIDTKYDEIALTVASKSTNYRQESTPNNAHVGDIWVVPSTGKQYQAVLDENDALTWEEIVSEDFAQLSVKVDEIDTTITNINGDITRVEEKAGKIDWLVASGTSAANMQLTSDALKAIADNVDLTANNTVKISSAGQISAAAAKAIDLSANETIQIKSAGQISAEAAKDIDLSANRTIKLQGESIELISTKADDAKTAADNAVASMVVMYAVSNSGTIAPESGWSTDSPQRSKGQFIWQKIVTTYNNGTTRDSDIACISGADGVDGSKGEDATLLRIDSSRGTVFKNNAVSTVLSAIIYHGSNRITNKADLASVFGNTAYLQWSWQRMDDDRYGVISSSDERLSNNGFSLTLSPDDVDVKVNFMCELIVD